MSLSRNASTDTTTNTRVRNPLQMRVPIASSASGTFQSAVLEAITITQSNPGDVHSRLMRKRSF